MVYLSASLLGNIANSLLLAKSQLVAGQVHAFLTTGYSFAIMVSIRWTNGVLVAANTFSMSSRVAVIAMAV